MGAHTHTLGVQMCRTHHKVSSFTSLALPYGPMDMPCPNDLAKGEASEAAPPHDMPIDDNDAAQNQPPVPKPVLLKFGDGVMSGVARGPNSDVEWDWSRVVEHTGMKSEKDHYYLKRNWAWFEKEFQQAEIPMEELQYRNLKAMKEDLQQHSMSSRALVLMISLICSNRRFAPAVKAKAVRLVAEILRVAVQAIGLTFSFVSMVFSHTQGWGIHTVAFDENGHSTGVDSLLQHHPGSMASWNALMTSGFCSYKLTSSPQSCSIWDLLVFLTWAKTNPSIKNVWSFVGQHVWPRAILVAGQILDKAALKSLGCKLEAPPLLKTRKGGHKRVPFVNRMMLLQKVKSARRHRKDAMQTHQDLVPKGSELVTHEQTIEVGLYLRQAQKAFQNACHFSIAWDPSTYDCETLVSCLWSNQVQKACYPPIQNMSPLVSSELEPELRELAAINKLTRIQGFTELRGLSHSMAAFGWPLQKFVLTDVHWRPLTSSEKRIRVEGKICIQDSDGKVYPQVPLSFNIQKQPLLHSITGQGSLNRAGLDYIQYKLGLTVLVSFDPYHRVWNDLRECLRRTGTLWKTFLSYALFFNINYGPGGSKAWFDKKVARRKEFLIHKSPHSSIFQDYLPFIQRERRLPEPSDISGVEEVFNTIGSLNNFNSLGPVAKLMRWFSWFEAEKFYRGEVWMSRMLMMDIGPTDGVDFAKKMGLSLSWFLVLA